MKRLLSRRKSSKFRKFLTKVQSFVKFSAMLAIVFGLIALFIYLLKADFLKVKWLECETNDGQMCQEKEIIFLDDLKGKNIFSLNPSKEEAELKKELLWIKQIKIKKRPPNKLLIVITHREPIVIFSKDEKVWYICDEEGFIFSKTTKKPNDLLTFFLPADFSIDLGDKVDFRLEFPIELVKTLKNEFIFIDKGYFDFPNLTLFLDHSRTASLSAEKPVDVQVGSLQFILRQSKIEGKLPGSIDLRFSKPVIKY